MFQPTIIDVPQTNPAPKATKKATTRKDASMPKTDDQPKRNGQETIAEMRDEYAATVKALREKHGDAKLIDQPVNFVTGRPLNKDATVVNDVRYFAAEYGWTDNRFATAGQIRANGGKISKDAHDVTMFFAMGDHWKYYKVYNYADVEWANGEAPTEFVRSAKRKATKKAPTKAAGGDKAIRAEVDELRRANDELRDMVAQLVAALNK